MLRRLLTILPFIALGALLGIQSASATPVCRENPLAVYGQAAGRYRMVEPCVTVTGTIMLLADESPEQGGERHVFLWTEVGNGDGWTDTEFVERAPLPPMDDLQVLLDATVTGTLVYDTTRGRYAVKPAWWLGEIHRAYPEARPDGSVWRVWQWKDGHYSEERVS